MTCIQPSISVTVSDEETVFFLSNTSSAKRSNGTLSVSKYITLCPTYKTFTDSIDQKIVKLRKQTSVHNNYRSFQTQTGLADSLLLDIPFHSRSGNSFTPHRKASQVTGEQSFWCSGPQTRSQDSLHLTLFTSPPSIRLLTASREDEPIVGLFNSVEKRNKSEQTHTNTHSAVQLSFCHWRQPLRKHTTVEGMDLIVKSHGNDSLIIKHSLIVMIVCGNT